MVHESLAAPPTTKPPPFCGLKPQFHATTSTFKRILKDTLYRLGGLSLYHRIRNRNVLTVAIFHRVLKDGDPRWRTALPQWTITNELFSQCLDFFSRHYNIVALPDVLAHLIHEPVRVVLMGG